MTMIIVGIAVFIAGIIFVLIRQSGNATDTARTSRNIKAASPAPVAVRQPSPEKDSTFPETPPTFSAAGDAHSSSLYRDLRNHLVKGIDRIFDEQPPAEASPPRLREQIDPGILEKALAQLAGMDRFRAEQLRLQKLLGDPAVQMTELSKSITSDPVMTAKVLKMANSSYFGVTQKIDSIGHALMILGLQNIKNIIYREGLREMFNAGSAQDKTAVTELWRHSNLVCVCAQHLHDLFEGLNLGTLFTLGIVHDIGKLILMEMSHNSRRTSREGSEYPMGLLIGEEDRLFGVNHAVIGGCILERWNFSDLMSQAVLMHHAPSFVEADQAHLPSPALKYALALFLSDQVARLFTDWNEGAANIYTMRGSYAGHIDRKRLIQKIIDVNFLNQMRAAEVIAFSERRM